MTPTNQRAGILLMIGAALIFSAQDALSRHLAETYNVFMVVMIRYWFFAAFVTWVAYRQAGGFRAAVRTGYPALQIFRGVLLVAEICVMVVAFTRLGLIEAHAIFAAYPLIVAALSGPVLGEAVGWRRWAAIGVGFVGVLVILDPGVTVFSPNALIPVVASFMFALYGLLTRYVARKDSAAVSYFWTGISGGVVMTSIGLWFWEPMTPADWGFMAMLCISGATAHYLLIRAYAVAEASSIQPFAYFQLPAASFLGIFIFGETLRTNVLIGAGIVVAAGLFTLWRARVRSSRAARQGAGLSGPSTDP
ncbi:DMT family transporter [Defluviimonas sp. WL0002]|uniref:DMT family transporter n=1 Tax=Albidovulum marisflavi TaxID=2984159 RepID=A0ABT2Z9X8_9RHOB|nr:DMT family transporter [Defluviimonas sp. WL0002]MCV2867888.1 DMT family transporter [Defluviimonas sp. WL0002]